MTVVITLLVLHILPLSHNGGSHMELTSRLGWLVTCSVVLMNTSSFSSLVIMFSLLWMISSLSHCMQ